jgi:hypothetical protein
LNDYFGENMLQDFDLARFLVALTIPSGQEARCRNRV